MTLAPLILTAKLDDTSFERLDGLRHTYFPPERNFLSAHVTLFHKLPGSDIEVISGDLRRVCSRYESMPIAFPGLRFLGRGSAVEVGSPALVRLRGELAERWANYLSLQDSQKFSPHVTIQNKVEPARARALFDRLKSTLKIPDGTITGLQLWHYEDGPWRLEDEFPFTSSLDRDSPSLGTG